MADWPWLFNDETLAGVVEKRTALAKAAREEGAEVLVRRLALDVPVPAGVREVSRWITQPFMDRFEAVPGGDLGIRAAYLFTGDASLLRVRPDGPALERKFMGEVVGDGVEVGHLRTGHDEALLLADIEETARRFADILKRLAADAMPHNAELARRIRAICAR